MNNTQTDYWHALDKTVAEKMQVNPQILGISHGIGDVAKGLKANIFAGAKVIELGFMGLVKVLDLLQQELHQNYLEKQKEKT